jgi:hypothetical protein
MRIIGKLLLLAGLFVLTSSFQTDQKRISVHMESKRLNNGKVIITKADIFYKYNEGVMISHYTYPLNYVFITNSKGEAKVYYPDKNEVIIQRNTAFSTENDVLYYFLNNKFENLGLQDDGFLLKESHFEDQMMISTWEPPANVQSSVSKIKMAHENSLPIYSAYYNTKDKVVKKIYYSDYMTSSSCVLPLRVTEIEYIKGGDSIVSRKVYSDIKLDRLANDSYFNFIIPSNAKLVELKK